jgi:hypothetical protein
LQAGIAAVAADALDRQRRFSASGEAKKAPIARRLRASARRDAVIDDVEKADRPARRADLARNPVQSDMVAAGEPARSITGRSVIVTPQNGFSLVLSLESCPAMTASFNLTQQQPSWPW